MLVMLDGNEEDVMVRGSGPPFAEMQILPSQVTMVWFVSNATRTDGSSWNASWSPHMTVAGLPEQPQSLIDLIFLYLTLPIILLGTVGNLLSVAVFRCTKLRRLSTGYYLTALSLSDTGFLLTLFASWLEMIGVQAFNRPVLCQLLLYTADVCCFLSPWLIVTFTVERFVATCYPLKCAMICTVTRAKAIVAVLTFVATSLYSYIFVMAGIVPRNVGAPTAVLAPPVYECGLKDSYQASMKILNTLDTVVTLVIPLALIVGLNIQIARAIWWFERIRRRMTTAANENGDSAVATALNGRRSLSCKRQQPRHVRGRYQVKITKMLLIISTIFIGLNSPSYLVRLWVFFRGEPAAGQQPTIADDTNLQQWSLLAFYLNFAINFLLYCVSGQNFRKALKSLFGKVIRKAHHRRLSRRNTGTILTNSAHVTNTTLAANLGTACQPCSVSVKVTSVKDSV